MNNEQIIQSLKDLCQTAADEGYIIENLPPELEIEWVTRVGIYKG